MRWEPHITDGVSEILKPQYVQVGLPPGFPKTVLNVVFADGTAEGLPISKKGAEELIAKAKITEI